MILQSQNTEVGKLFAMNAHDSSVRMENSSKRMEIVTKNMHKIAKVTERDTSSMHIITFFTLVFLPGTFLGVRILLLVLSRYPIAALIRDQTFFSTPIIESNVDGSDSGTPWNLDERLLLLFMEICFPLMAFTIGVWFMYLRYKASRREKAEKGVGDV
jgi:hypothetical protein